MKLSKSTITSKAIGLGLPAFGGRGKAEAHQCVKRCGCDPPQADLKTADQRGFTLVEIIVTLVAAGILAVFYIHYMGTAMGFSWKSVELVEGEARAEGLMERIIAEYVEQINSDPNNALVYIEGREGIYETDPDYGSAVTMEYIVYDTFGNYTVLPFPTTSNNLKVTVEAPGSDFTTILTRSRVGTDNPIVYY